MNVSDTLNLAADLIEERGWAVGSGFNDGDGAPLCLEGGIMAAVGVTADDKIDGVNGDDWIETCPSYLAVQSYLHYHRALWHWNDDEGRTATEVVEVLRATALIESAREREAAAVNR